MTAAVRPARSSDGIKSGQMTIVRDPVRMQELANGIREAGMVIGFVPTMGFLHEGHVSLLRAARRRSDAVVLSIFVNPTQFGPDEDLDKYPRNMERDERIARKEGVDYVFYPEQSTMYPSGFQTYVIVEQLTRSHCADSRPVHFRGVSTICSKLFNIVMPHRAFFGQKDYQQAAVIRRMVEDLNMNLEIVVLPTVREADGLAMSSRNEYLGPEERKDALCLYEALQTAKTMVQAGETSAGKIVAVMREDIERRPLARVDYVSIADPHTLEEVDIIEKEAVALLAAFVGKTRLIDNEILSVA